MIRPCIFRRLLVALLAGLASSPGATLGDESALKRWAVLASPGAHDSGLAGVVLAGLSKIDDVVLVERDRLDAIADELEVSALFDVAPQRRLRVGRLLNADALLLIARNDADGDPRVEVGVIDCRRGIRLTTVYLSGDTAQLESTGAAVCQAVRDALARYADGVSRIVAVSPFVSKDIVHSYDYLQSGFAELIRMGCLALPGVAVVELDEARAIQQELALSKEHSVRPWFPILIDGEYKVTESAPGEVKRVVIDVRIRRSNQQSGDVRLGPIPLSEARSDLLTNLPRTILNRDVADKTSLEAQHEWLTSRAARFADLGVWDHAARLREAALLLRPGDVSLHVALLENYRELFREPTLWRATAWNSAEDEAAFRRLLQQKATAYLAGLGHLEYLIRNESLDAVQAAEWTRRYGTQQILGSPPSYRAAPIDPAFQVARRQCLASVESAKERFLLDVFPRVLRFSSSPSAASRDLAWRRLGMAWTDGGNVVKHVWHDVAVELMLRRSDRDCPNAHDFDFILRMFTTRVPDGLRESTEMIHFLGDQGRRFRLQDAPASSSNTDAWTEFLARLERADHKMARLHARYARLAPSIRAAGSMTDDQRRQLVDEIRKFQDDYEATLRSVGSGVRPTDGWLYPSCNTWLKRLSPPAPAHASRPKQAVAPSGGQQDARRTGRLEFKTVDWTLVTIDGRRTSFRHFRRTVSTPLVANATISGLGSLHGVVRCGDRLDALWGPWSLYLSDEPGVVRETVRRDESTFRDVAWDGKSIWVATEQGEIWRMAGDGEVEAKISSEHGLLPSDQRLVIEPVTEGRLIASGSFGPHKRGWCAEITCPRGEELSVRVFHEAKRVAPPSASDGDVEPWADLCFIPTGMHRFESGDDTGRDVMLVGRQDRWRPLAVDLNTLEVSVFPRRLRDIRRDSLYSGRGNTIKPDVEGVYLNGLPDHAFPGRPLQNLCPTRGLVGNLNALSRKVLQHNGWLYVPGEVWWRIHPVTFKPELLTPQRLPNEYTSVYRFDISAHYGILAWNAGLLYQVNPD